jgi:hypothetical protein
MSSWGMAGGMGRGGLRMPLHARVREASPVEAPAPARHCWVLDPADRHGVKRPGVLLEWRRSAAGEWEGRVVYSAQLREGQWAGVEEWLPAALLAPA